MKDLKHDPEGFDHLPKKRYVVSKIKADEPTVNGRIYSEKLMISMVEKLKFKIHVASGVVMVYDSNSEHPPVLRDAVAIVADVDYDHADGRILVDLSPFGDRPMPEEIMPMTIGTLEEEDGNIWVELSAEISHFIVVKEDEHALGVTDDQG